MRELRYPEPPVGRLYVAGTNFKALWWHVNFVEKILTVTIELPDSGFNIGKEPVSLALWLPQHTICGKRMLQIGAPQFATNNTATVRMSGDQLFIQT